MNIHTLLCMRDVKRVNPKSSHYKEKMFSLLSSISLYCIFRDNVNQMYWGNNFTIYILHMYIYVSNLYAVYLKLIQWCMLIMSQWNWGKKDGTQQQEVLEALKRYKINDIFLFLVSEILDMITFFDISRPLGPF